MIQVSNVNKSFGKHQILRNISIDVESGEQVVLHGASGSGKSTLLYLIGALERADSGTIFIDGQDITRFSDDGLAYFRNTQIGLVFQFHFLLHSMSALDNILLPADGSPAVRIDNGGSLTFRAQGGKKPFNKVVTEIDTMRNKTISPQAAKIFGNLTDTDIDTQIKTIIVPNYELILSLTPDELKEAMKARMDNLIERTVWTNASAFKNAVETTSEPEYIPAVQKALIEYFKAGWLKNFKVGWFKIKNENKGAGNSDEQLLAFINKTLKDNGAVISGGFILKAIGSFVDEKSVDIDIFKKILNVNKYMYKYSNMCVRKKCACTCLDRINA